MLQNDDMSAAYRFITALVVVVAAAAAPIALPAQQETKPVPKDSVRVALPGCTKGYVFTAGRRTVDEPGVFEIPEGMHLRMNGPKKLMTEIKAHEGSMVEIVGIMKKSQYKEGVDVGGGVRVSGAGSSGGSRLGAYLGPGHPQIDVEGWRPLEGACKT
jgi:hypothetical protein